MTVGAGGVAHAVGNGSATITVHHDQFVDTAAVVIEAGVTLDSLDLSPASATLRAAGAAILLTLNGHFSGGEIQEYYDGRRHDLRVSEPRRRHCRRNRPGRGREERRRDHHGAQRRPRGHGHGARRRERRHWRRSGAVRDDSKGLPLSGAVATLVADGGGPLAAPTATPVDNQGRFELTGLAGDAVVRVAPGSTTVERRITIRSPRPFDSSTPAHAN